MIKRSELNAFSDWSSLWKYQALSYFANCDWQMAIPVNLGIYLDEAIGHSLFILENIDVKKSLTRF